MKEYVDLNTGNVVTARRGEGLEVHITGYTTGVAQVGVLVSEEQSVDGYMSSVGYVPCGVPGNITGLSNNKHWHTELVAAMEELTLATDDHNKATGRLTRAQAAFERAKSNAENSILGS